MNTASTQPLLTHFVMHGERAVMGSYLKQKRGHSRRVAVVRTICDSVAANIDTKTLREDLTVTCPKCMVMKDVWLSQPKRKPLTVRRARMLRRSL